MGDMNCFITSELLLPYEQFTKLAKEREADLRPEVHEWLCEWQDHDFATSPRDDSQRRFERLGHYRGWMDGREARLSQRYIDQESRIARTEGERDKARAELKTAGRDALNGAAKHFRELQLPETGRVSVMTWTTLMQYVEHELKQLAEQP